MAMPDEARVQPALPADDADRLLRLRQLFAIHGPDLSAWPTVPMPVLCTVSILFTDLRGFTRLTERFAHDPAGLMEVLIASNGVGGPSALPAAIRETSVTGLSVLPCGALPSNAAHLLSGTRMRILLQELREQYDIIVLDTPPVLATADAGIVASLTDGVLLVVRAGTTDRNAAQRAYQQLANVGARVVGTVLNDPGGEVAKEGDYYYPYDYAAEEQ